MIRPVNETVTWTDQGQLYDMVQWDYEVTLDLYTTLVMVGMRRYLIRLDEPLRIPRAWRQFAATFTRGDNPCQGMRIFISC